MSRFLFSNHFQGRLASLRLSLTLAVAAGVMTAIITLLIPNYYQSEVRLLPVEGKSLGGNLGSLANAAATFGVNLPGADGNDANYVDILNSRWLKEQLLKTEFEYQVRPRVFGQVFREKRNLYDYLGSANLDRALVKLATVYGATRDLKSKVIAISAETTCPELSQAIVQKASRLLEAFLLEKGRTRGGARAAFAEARLIEARQNMGTAEETLRRFLQVNRNYASSSDPDVRLRGIRFEAELRLTQQLVTNLAMNREQALLEEKNDLPILNVLDPGSLPIEKSRPARNLITLLVVILVGVCVFGWEERQWIRENLLPEADPMAEEEPTSSGRGGNGP